MSVAGTDTSSATRAFPAPSTGMRWFTSDTHFGHDNIIGFCGRPYASTDHMNADMLTRLAAPMRLGDSLWHVGDLALGVLDLSLPFISGVGVPVTLVAGNHDRCHPYYGKKSVAFEDVYRDKANLAALITTHTTITLLDDTEVNVSHFPYASTDARPVTNRHGKTTTTDKFASWRLADDGRWLLCGHVHEKWRQRDRMINVGIDAWGGRPVSEAQIVELIAAGPRDLDRLPWAA